MYIYFKNFDIKRNFDLNYSFGVNYGYNIVFYFVVMYVMKVFIGEFLEERVNFNIWNGVG